MSHPCCTSTTATILRHREDVRLRVARTGHDGIAAALG
jgi:signal transduction histidine kinase